LFACGSGKEEKSLGVEVEKEGAGPLREKEDD